MYLTRSPSISLYLGTRCTIPSSMPPSPKFLPAPDLLLSSQNACHRAPSSPPPASNAESLESEAEKLEMKSEYCLRKGRMGRRDFPTVSGGAWARRSFLLVDDSALRRASSSCEDERSPSSGVCTPSLSSVPPLLHNSGSGEPEFDVGGLSEGRRARLLIGLRGSGFDGRSGTASSSANSITCDRLSTSEKLEKISAMLLPARMGTGPTEEAEVDAVVLVAVVVDEEECVDSTVEVRERLASPIVLVGEMEGRRTGEVGAEGYEERVEVRRCRGSTGGKAARRGW